MNLRNLYFAFDDCSRYWRASRSRGSAIITTFDVARYRMLSSQENIWDTEQRE